MAERLTMETKLTNKIATINQLSAIKIVNYFD